MKARLPNVSLLEVDLILSGLFGERESLVLFLVSFFANLVKNRHVVKVARDSFKNQTGHIDEPIKADDSLFKDLLVENHGFDFKLFKESLLPECSLVVLLFKLLETWLPVGLASNLAAVVLLLVNSLSQLV